MKLSNIECKNAKPKKKSYKLSDGGGLYLEVATSGSKYWRMKYRFNGKENRLSFGTYPQVSLAERQERSVIWPKKNWIRGTTQLSKRNKLR